MNRIRSVQWVGPAAEAFLLRWDSEAEEQDSCSSVEDSGGNGDDGGGDGTPWEHFVKSVNGDGHMESDGFFGDLPGGPESGMLGNIAWNSLSAAVDVTSMIPGVGLPGKVVGLAMELPSIGIGLYDMAQSFQDGELLGTVDGAVTAGINTLDSAAGILSVIPYTAPAGAVYGIFTSGLDALWSGATVATQLDAINNGDHGGSASRFLLERIGVDPGLLGWADDLFATGTEKLRDAVPFIDPMIDVSQPGVESIIPQGAQQVIEGGATVVNDVLDSVLPW